jgi:membrane protease YdiL (CAAX protease family)
VRDATTRHPARFGKDPVYRKELLWFARDRSALVQALLIPLTIAGVQLFNWRDLVAQAQSSWNIFCGAGVLFGTYLFSVLGPRSLASEGNALWIALTWPRGLESLLKAKARLWTLLSSAIVALVCCYAIYLFPASWWKIVLVGIAWVPFARSMAEKAVTLATVTSESGETQQVSAGRRWAVQLGMLTFSIGVLTAQWTLVVTGIVYSIVTAAAMWQNLRARLPYLYDPWSETLPTPPTLMHAMIAISVMVETSAVVSGFAALFGSEWIALARAVMYGIIAGVVSVAVAMFLDGRGVPIAEIWSWRDSASNSAESGDWFALPAGSGNVPLSSSVLAGIGLGVLLGLFGQAYINVLHLFPSVAEILDRSDAQLAAIPHLRVSLLVMTVLIAPIAEEYLFRGLLYRALDREWGGWRAALGSAAFFAVYHPLLAWLPVGMLGLINSVMFKKTGRLAPAVAVHMVYNFIVMI